MMRWTDRIRQVKIFLVVTAVVIVVASLVVSHHLVKDLATEEYNKVEIWAEAMRSLNSADENTDLSLVLKVMDGNNTIPVVVVDNHQVVQIVRNVRLKAANRADSLREAEKLALRLREQGKSIRIDLDSIDKRDYIEVCYDDSLMLKRLNIYPYVQLGIVMIFVVVAIFSLLTSKRAEQNKVWVGLSKETAHQLGTPISSLMAWTEMLKETYPQDELIPEMNQDVKRLQLIAERFSKIGSLPELTSTDLREVVEHVSQYMKRRTSHHVQIISELPAAEIRVMANASLFEWVVENLCKNAVDAMEGQGSIRLMLSDGGDNAYLDVSDTGKGIKKKDLRNVFKPGFTTKERGWGLGLSLAKRIVEQYHHGRIYVKNSTVGKGTTFRIELRKPRKQ